MTSDFDIDIAKRDKEIEDIFVSMIVGKLSNTKACDLQKEIHKITLSIMGTIWEDKKLNETILLYIYGYGENIGTDEINYSYQYGILSTIQDALEQAITKIALDHIFKESSI